MSRATTDDLEPPSPALTVLRSLRWRRHAFGLGLLLVLTVVSLGAFQVARALPESPLFLSLGYPGVFLLTMACSATLFLPVPAWGAVTVAGGVLNPVLLGLAAGAGAATGEMTGYLAGRGGRMVLGAHSSGLMGRVWWLVNRHAFLTLFLLSVIPNPLFDVAGLTAGSLRYSPARYWLAVALGKSCVYTALAVGGQTLAPLFT
ncbi:MAG: VTT domain-containing protein [Chloroflexota bacterium]